MSNTKQEKAPVDTNIGVTDADIDKILADAGGNIPEELLGAVGTQMKAQSEEAKRNIFKTVLTAGSGFAGNIMGFFTSPAMKSYTQTLVQSTKDEAEKRIAELMLEFLWTLILKVVPDGDNWIRKTVARENGNRFVKFFIVLAISMPLSNMLMARVPKLQADGTKASMELAKFSIVLCRLLSRMLIVQGGKALNVDSIQQAGVEWFHKLLGEKLPEINDLVKDISDKDVIDVSAQIRTAANSKQMAA